MAGYRVAIALSALSAGSCWMIAGTDDFSEEQATTSGQAGPAGGNGGEAQTGGAAGAGGIATGGGGASQGGGGGAAQCATAFAIFVTSTQHTPGAAGPNPFLGLVGADDVCDALAGAPTGTYRAWLSDLDKDAIDRLGTPTGPWCTRRGELVFESLASIPLGPQVPIDVDENGNIVSGEVWTGTDVTGVATNDDCVNWTAGSSNVAPTVGQTNPGSQIAFWTDNGNTDMDCNLPRRLYCIQVAP